ncbi:MAG: branched-chain amino acid ABC transporter permease [Hyphomicrobiales bacterium]
MAQFVEYSLVGIASGGIYILSAMGFVIIYKASNIFNFAMGEMMMIGAYLFYAAVVQLHLSWPLGLLVALLGSAILALAIERALLRPMLGQPVVVLVMITLGVGSILRGAAGLVFGPDIVQLPDFLPRQPVFLGDILIPGKLAWGFVAVLLLAGAFILYYRYSRAGVAIRATASDQVTAESLGINIRQVFSLTWALGGVLAAAPGIVAGALNGVTPQLGTVALNVLAVVMLSGMTSVEGVVVAGIFIGWLETVTGAYLGASWQNFLPYLVVLLVMLLRPSGLFGEQRVERI